MKERNIIMLCLNTTINLSDGGIFIVIYLISNYH